ncbi:sensor histidine kinase [Kaistia terrae]|uniref:histidine kinase n=1 Tax=Kaistia terrae TaxID=537017 RepID=A0ABW0PZ74_9HYPH|nr:CHASE3 domain-containing protein [Kaistia terrae]MCX5580501.1 CHASE3 domain-containing protein [Kaistia terrae]
MGKSLWEIRGAIRSLLSSGPNDSVRAKMSSHRLGLKSDPMPISKNALVRSTVLFILLGLAALLAIVAAMFWLVGETDVNSKNLIKARSERSSLITLRGLGQDAETGQRGYLLTGNPLYLAPFEDARAKFPEQMDKVQAAFADNPELAGLTARLRETLTAKFAELERTIELFKSGQRDAALAIVDADSGRELMDEARQFFERAIERADQSVIASIERQQRGIDLLRWVTFFGALVILVVVGGSAWTVWLYTRQLVAAQREVAILNTDLEKRVTERTSDLGRANEEIQRFAYIVTHDLRAPLVNIMGFTSELEASLEALQAYIGEAVPAMEKATPYGEVDEKGEAARLAAFEELPEAITFIRSSTRKMDALINAILKLSREGRRTLKPEGVDLQALLENAGNAVRHQIVEAGGELIIEGKPPTALSDRLTLEQIFGNLLDNAVKYRAPQRPLRIHIQAATGPGNTIVVKVADNGRGIAIQDHERIFELFRRSGSQDQPGEGIGLAHVRSMARNIGGDIVVRSELGTGSTFELTFARDLHKIIGAA